MLRLSISPAIHEPMEPSRQEFNLFIRRWQVRLFIAAFTLPALLFVFRVFFLRGEEDVTMYACVITGGVFLLTTLLLQAWCFEKKKPAKRGAVAGEPIGR